MPIGLAELTGATGGTVARRGAEQWGGVTIDGRAARAGDLYFAIRGERFDGHDFCGQAVAAGATGVVVERGRGAALPSDAAATVVEVDDTRVALGQAARAIRRAWGGTVVAVTGSAGKTTTKQLIASMLAGVVGEGAVVASEGSLNNETGVPLTLARLRSTHRYAVVEMGMRGLGQIDYLAQWAEPDAGVVVNAGIAHVGVVGSVEAIARGKAEVWGRLRNGGHAIYPHGDERLRAHASAAVPAGRHATFGAEAGATVRLRDVEARGVEGSDAWFDVTTPSGARVKLPCRVPLVGRHNAHNAGCALAVAVALGLDLEQAARGIASARPARQRSEIVELGGRHILLDCYNANPASMRAALETLGELARARRAVAVLGDMLELGEHEVEEHAKIGALLPDLGVSFLVTIGERAQYIARAALDARVPHVAQTSDPALAARVVASWTDPGDWILVKASRGMRLERVVEALGEVVG